MKYFLTFFILSPTLAGDGLWENRLILILIFHNLKFFLIFDIKWPRISLIKTIFVKFVLRLNQILTLCEDSEFLFDENSAIL